MAVSTTSPASTIWALTDDRAGNRSQCLGVADALGMPFEVRELAYGALAGLPNILLGASFAGLSAPSRAAFKEPWPAAVIAAGRRTAPVARRIKRLSMGGTRLIQIMDPGAGYEDFDLIAVPNHDQPRTISERMVRITGAPHGVTASALASADQKWREALQPLPSPRVAVIVGGSTRRRPLTAQMAHQLGTTVTALAKDAGGSLMVTTSRRTEAAAADALVAALGAPARVYRWGEEGENPYLGFLAVADAVVVTGESVSMCSEACAAGGPVFIHAPPALITDKHARLHEELYAGGYARPLTANWESFTPPPLNTARVIADAARSVLGG